MDLKSRIAAIVLLAQDSQSEQAKAAAANAGADNLWLQEAKLDGASALTDAVQKLSADLVEECARSLELSRASLLLLAGEMTAQEMRTVRAVLANRASTIRRVLTDTPMPPTGEDVWAERDRLREECETLRHELRYNKASS